MIKWSRVLRFSSTNVIEAGAQKMKKLEFKVFKGMKRARLKIHSVQELMAKR